MQHNVFTSKSGQSQLSHFSQGGKSLGKSSQQSYQGEQPCKQKSKYFTFDGNSIFNPKNPVSPARGHLATEFVMKQIGKDNYEKVLSLLRQSDDPLRLLDIGKDLVAEAHDKLNNDLQSPATLLEQ